MRMVGAPNPDRAMAKLEGELLEAARKLGIGPMGARGINCVLGIHIEKAVTHTAALPVAVNAQCLVGRRWKAVLAADGAVLFSGDISNWRHKK